MNYLIISSSLNKQSRSRVLARYARSIFFESNKKVAFIDLQDYDLPFCDGGPSFDHPQVRELQRQIRNAEAILVAAPVYNYGLNAASKNLLDLTFSSWEEKIIGLMLSGGGRNSYMAGMGFLNSLMFNARCLIIPRFVYALEEEIGETEIQSVEIRRRVSELVQTAIRLTERLKSD